MNIPTSIVHIPGKANKTVVAVLFCLLTLASSSVPANDRHRSGPESRESGAVLTPSAKFEKLWVDYDITEAGQRGMRIHVKFTAFQLRNIDASLAVYFETADGKRLRDRNGRINSSAGDVAVYNHFRPQTDPAVYNDMSVFMPYDELELGDGSWDLRMDVKLIYKTGGLIQQLTYHNFNYRRGAVNTPSTTTNTKAAGGKVEKIWADYDVTEKGQKGMRVHVKFEVFGLRDVDCYLRVRVQKGKTLLASATNEYANAEGELHVQTYLTPGYDPTHYEDVQVFLPYSEILLPRGKHDLELDVDLVYPDGKLIQHLDFFPFVLNR